MNTITLHFTDDALGDLDVFALESLEERDLDDLDARYAATLCSIIVQAINAGLRETTIRSRREME